MKTASVQLSKNRDDLRREFFALKSPRQVAALLEVDYAHLTYLLYRSPVEKRYEIFSIAKRSGGQRLLMKPASSLAIAQSKLLEVFNAVYRPRRCVQGFAEERSIVGNAAIHARSGAVLNADLLDFFPSINFGRVRGMLIARPYGLPPAVATVLAQLCCFKNQLPQGAPTSPIVANMLCARLDAELLRLAKSCGARYSRYADDLTFSTNGDTFDDQIAVVTGRTVQLGSALQHVIVTNGFKVNPAKIHLRKPNERQEVTGLVVNRKPNVRRTRVRQIRAMLHALHRWGPNAAEVEFHSKYAYRRYYPVGHKPDFRRVLRGRISFVGMVRGRHDALYLRLHNRYCEIDPEWADKRIAGPTDVLAQSLWVLESEAKSITATAFALEGYGLVTCQHVLAPDLVAYRSAEPQKRFQVAAVAADETIDLAILKIEHSLSSSLAMSNNEVQLHQRITVAGFPNHNVGDAAYIEPGFVVQFRMRSGVRRFHVSARIVAGNSGGPVVDEKNRVVGIAATGADSISEAHKTEEHGVIPVSALKHLSLAAV